MDLFAMKMAFRPPIIERHLLASCGATMLLLSCTGPHAHLPVEYGPPPVAVCFFAYQSALPDPLCREELKNMITSPTNEGPHAYIAITGYIAASEVDGKIYNDLPVERQKALSDILVSLGIPATLITCHLQDPIFARQTKDPDSTKDRRAAATLSHFAQKPCPWSYQNRLE